MDFHKLEKLNQNESTKESSLKMTLQFRNYKIREKMIYCD